MCFNRNWSILCLPEVITELRCVFTTFHYVYLEVLFATPSKYFVQAFPSLFFNAFSIFFNPLDFFFLVGGGGWVVWLFLFLLVHITAGISTDCSIYDLEVIHNHVLIVILIFQQKRCITFVCFTFCLKIIVLLLVRYNIYPMSNFVCYLGPTTVSPGISSSGSNVDTSTVVIASVCSLLGLVLLVVLIILSRKIRLHRKKRNANSDSNFGAIEINGTARDPLHRQISLRTQEDVNTFVPIFLGRLDSFEETPFDGEKEDGIEDAEARRKRYASSSALRHSQSFENEYSDIHQMTQTTNKYHDAPSSRFQKNPTYAGDSTEHQYADMIPDSSERGSKRSIEHHYEAINTPNAQGNTYHIPLLLKQNSTENPYDLPKCEPTNHIFPTPSSEYDQPTYLNENGVDIMLYDELPGKSRQSSFRKSVKLADTSVLNADVVCCKHKSHL